MLEVEKTRSSVTVGVVVGNVVVIVVVVVGVVGTKDSVVEPVRCGLELVIRVGVRFGVRVG